MFVIQVSPNLSVTRWLQELELEGITTVIRTVDGFLSQRFLSDLFDIESDSVKLLSFRYHKDYESETEYVPRQASSMLCSGHFPSVMYGATILAALIALIMMLAGSFVQLTPTLVIVYNLIVMGVALLIQHIKKL